MGPHGSNSARTPHCIRALFSLCRDHCVCYRYIAFFVLTCDIVIDTREQDFSAALRRFLLPIWIAPPRPLTARALASWASMLAMRWLLKLVELCYCKASRALLPMALTMLLIVYGSSAVSVRLLHQALIPNPLIPKPLTASLILRAEPWL
jgi:hypothetical protein